MTLVYMILCHNQEQAQCYQINVNLKTQSKKGGGVVSIHPLLLYHGRVLGYELFVQVISYHI